MTIDAGLSSCDNVTTTSSAPPSIQKSLPVSSHHLREVVEEEEDEEDDEDTSISVANLSAQASQLGGEIPVSMVNTSLTQSPDFSALMASAKSGLLQVRDKHRGRERDSSIFDAYGRYPLTSSHCCSNTVI